MNKTIAACMMLVTACLLLVLSAVNPSLLNDNNAFLKSFVGPDMLAFLGVTVTITLASAANMHLELNKIEEKYNKIAFTETRASIRKSAYWLIGMLLMAVIVLVIKQWVSEWPHAASIVNCSALMIVLFNILVLIDLTGMAFSIGPDIKER